MGILGKISFFCPDQLICSGELVYFWVKYLFFVNILSQGLFKKKKGCGPENLSIITCIGMVYSEMHCFSN